MRTSNLRTPHVSFLCIFLHFVSPSRWDCTLLCHNFFFPQLLEFVLHNQPTVQCYIKLRVYIVLLNQLRNIKHQPINQKAACETYLCPQLYTQVSVQCMPNTRSESWCCQWSQCILHDKHLGKCQVLLLGYSMAHDSCHLQQHMNMTYKFLFQLHSISEMYSDIIYD
jgi:hypothetical protein